MGRGRGIYQDGRHAYIYGKTPSNIFFSRVSAPISIQLGIYHVYNWRLEPIIVCSNDKTLLTLPHFTTRPNFET